MNSLARLSSPSFHLAPPPGPSLLPPGPPQCFLHSATKETVYVRLSHPCSAQSLSLALASCTVKTKVLIVAHKALHNCPHLLFQGHHLRPLSLAHSRHLPPLFLKHSRLAPTPDLFTSCFCCPTKCSFPDIPMALSSPPSGFCSNFTSSVRLASKYSPWGLPGSPVVRLCTSTVGGMGSIPGQGTPTGQGATRKQIQKNLKRQPRCPS